ncbi:MAG: thiamine phosphate synthase [Reyranella sp.]|nr:thiamine phosphate synthase [Reyranella sp.]
MTRLYLISPERLEHPAIFADDLRAALNGGDVAAFQLRLKDVADDAISRAADTLRPICQQRDVAFIMNDRPDLAVKLDCDGVHVGQDDMSYAEARRIVGPQRQIGVTCKASRDLAMTVGEAGADYVAFGAFFPSTTKAITTPAPLEIIEWWSELFEIPCVAIGGITVENCPPVIAAGADFLAVAGGVWNHKDGPEAAVRAFNEIFSADR